MSSIDSFLLGPERRFNSAFIKISIIISKVDFLTPAKRRKDSALRSLIAEYYLP